MIKLNQRYIMAVNNFILYVLSLIFLPLFSMNPMAQTKLKSNVLSNAGTPTSGKSKKIVGTLGQSTIGRSSSEQNNLGIGFWEQISNLISSIETVTDNTIPTEFSLDQNYPNPFNPTTIIQFALPVKTLVSIKLYDALGREVRSLLNKEMEPGIYKLHLDARELASGIYFYQIQANNFIQTRKMLIIK